MQTDPELGRRIQKILQDQNLEPSAGGNLGALDTDHDKHLRGMSTQLRLEHHFHEILANLNLNLDDPSLQETPSRVARMYCEELFYGLDYANFPSCTLFPHDLDELVVITDIEVKSMCEHHFIPFIGTAAVGYIPAKQILGLSKFNRVVDFFSRRPQVQERLTAQIALALKAILGTEDVAVVISAEHLCAKLRGVKAFQQQAITSNMQGRFRAVEALRAEFMSLAGRK